jgi:hypothetical protein
LLIFADLMVGGNKGGGGRAMQGGICTSNVLESRRCCEVLVIYAVFLVPEAPSLTARP